MTERSVALITHQAGSCPLIKPGDRWTVTGNEVRCDGGSLCGAGLTSIFPKLTDLLKSIPADGKLPDDYLLCDQAGCDAAFRMEFLQKMVMPPPLPVAHGTTRRLERGASAATTILRKQGPFLSRLSKDLAAELIGACTTKRYEDGQIILMQGVVGDHLYIVGEGAAEVARWGKSGDETILVTLGVGECFGEMSILTGEPTSAEVRSKGTSAVLSLYKDKLETLLMNQPLLSREFSKLLADRLKATNVSLESELSRGVLGKLSMISLVDLVQTLHQGRQTGTLVLNYAGQQARLGFRAGNLCTGTVTNPQGAPETQGDEAFYKVVCWPDGDFCFEATVPDEDGPGRIKLDIMGLMMEGMRRIDELKANAAAQNSTEPQKL